MKDSLVIIPAYNEEESIEIVLEDVLGVFKDKADVLVIDDGSRDKTAILAKKAGADVISLSTNQGAGAAAQTGYIYASRKGYQFAGQIDADGQHRGEDLARLFDQVKDKKANLAIGSRYLKDTSGYKSTPTRRAGSFLFRSLLRILTGKNITDITSGLRVADRKVIYLFSLLFDPDYAEIEALQRVLNSGLVVEEVAVSMRERQGGSSTISTSRAISYTLKNTLVLLAGRFRRKEDRAILEVIDAS